MTKPQQTQTATWDELFREVEQSQKDNSALPDPDQYRDLTKSAGGK